MTTSLGARATIVLFALATAAAACAPATPGGSGAGSQAPSQTTKKRLVAAALGDIFTVSSYLATGGTGTAQPGVPEVEKLVHAGLGTKVGDRIEARLAEAAPTTDNGLWRVFPDGTMEITWRILPNARWHDGTPLTSEDLVFTAMASQDREIDFTKHVLYSYIERIDTPDEKTIVVKWKSPYIWADNLFSVGGTLPMPKHILEEQYAANKAALPQLSYWNRDFVGTGPYRLREWVPSSHVILEPNDDYPLGRPKIDEIEVRSIQNPSTAAANVLSGTVQLTIGRGLSIETAMAFKDRWPEGRIELKDSGNPTVLGPQFLNPSPPVVGDVRFRRALNHALNRPEMALSLQGGLVEASDSGLPYGDPSYTDVEPSVVRYEYDPRKASQMIEEIGYARGGDGMFRDAAGQPLSVQVVSSSTDLYIRTGLASVDYWRRVGVDAEPYTVPDARERDLEFRANYPGFEVVSSGSGIDGLNNFRSSELRVAENAYRGRNRARYASAELDALIDRYFTTIPTTERHLALAQVLNHMTGNVVNMWLFYNGHAMAIGDQLVNVSALEDTANAHLWDVRS